MSMKTNAGFPGNLLSKINALISGLRGDITTIQNSITNLQSSVTSIGNRVTTLETNANGTHVSNAVSISRGTKDYEDTIKKNKQVSIFCNVKSSNIPSSTTNKTQIGTLANGYKPNSNIKRKVNCGSSTGGGNSWFSDLYISSTGVIEIDNRSGFTVEEYNFDISFIVS